MNNKVIFYDFDGVIKDSTSVKTEAFYLLYKSFGENIALKVKKHHIENGGVSRFEKFKLYHKEFLEIDLSKHQVDELANQFSELVLQQVINSNYVKGALETIKLLANNYHQFIITGTPQKEIEIILEKLEINRYFKEICGSPKNKIEWSDYLLKKYKIKNENVVFIGDAMSDYNAAIKYDFKFILREHEENESLFKNYNMIKIKNLVNLEEILNNFK